MYRLSQDAGEVFAVRVHDRAEDDIKALEAYDPEDVRLGALNKYPVSIIRNQEHNC